MDIEQARYNMIEQQIRPWEVLDDEVLDLLYEVKREEYVPPEYQALAFTDMEIPLGSGEYMLTPKLEARILQVLAVSTSDKVLEVGTGSGYMTALLARRSSFVHSVEILAELHAFAQENLKAHHVHNVLLEVGDAARGWPKHAPYDVIVLTGSTPVLAPQFFDSLAPGGRLFAVVGDPPIMKALLYTVAQKGVIGNVELFETCIRPLKNAPQPERFVF